MAHQFSCKVCGSAATVHVSFVSGPKISMVSYCHDHAKEAGVLQSGTYDLLGDSKVMKPMPELSGPACPECGYTRQLWKQTGRLGCPSCYDTFHDEVSALIPRMHRGTTHTGRIPKGKAQTQAVTNRIRALQEALERAIKDERYEDAALARDEMTDLRAQLKAE